MKNIFFETERLVFRNWIDRDADLLADMNSDKEVMEFFPRTLTREESILWQKEMRLKIKINSYGFWAVEKKESREWIGFIGLNDVTFNSDFTPCMEIGWRLSRKFWGNGYATEGAKACLIYGKEKLGVNNVYSFTSKLNLRSENVMIKIGLKKLKEFGHPRVEKNHPLHLHVLYKTEVM